MSNLVKEYVKSCGNEFKKITNLKLTNIVNEINVWDVEQIFVGAVNDASSSIGISHSHMSLDKNFYKDSFFHNEGICIVITDHQFDQKKGYYSLYEPLIWIKEIKQK